MAFQKTEAYWQHRIGKIQLAITEMKDRISLLEIPQLLDAHQEYLKHLERELDRTNKLHAEWKAAQ